MNDFDVEWYVEYSPIQKCFHVEQLQGIQEHNLRSCYLNRVNGYVIIAGPLNYKEAGEFITRCQHLKENKSQPIIQTGVNHEY